MIPNFRHALREVVDAIRGIPDDLDLREYSVAIRVRTWNGSRPGVDSSTATDVDSYFYVDGGTHRPRVKQVTQRDIIASGGVYQDQDLRIGPLTPPYPGGAADNTDVSVLDPAITSSATEIFFLITGPGMGSNGSWFKKITMDVTRPFTRTFVVRRTGETP
jgi:hypothetical protein